MNYPTLATHVLGSLGPPPPSLPSKSVPGNRLLVHDESTVSSSLLSFAGSIVSGLTNITTNTANHSTSSALSDDAFLTSDYTDNNPMVLEALSDRDFLADDDGVLPCGLRSALVISYVAIIVLAVTGNMAVIAVVLSNAKLRTVTNMFLVSLAVSDLLIAGVNMPLQLRFYGQKEWVDGEVLCRLGSYMQGVVVVASIFTLAGIALDRYYAILHPLRARHVHTVRRALILIAIFWTAAFALVVPQLFLQRLEPKLVIDKIGSNQEEGESHIRIVEVCVEYFPSHGLSVAYTLFFYIFLYLLPVAIMVITYGRIVHRLWNRRPIGETGTTSGSVSRTASIATGSQPSCPSTPSTDAVRRRLAEKKRIVRMLVIVVALFALGWFPFFTVHVYQLFRDANGDGNHLRVLVAMLQLVGYANSCANPIVYCFLNDSFQQYLYRLLVNAVCRCCCCCSARARQWAATAAAAGGRRQQVEVSSYRRRGAAAAAAGSGNGNPPGGGIMMTSLVTMATTRQFSRASAEQCVSTAAKASVVGTGV